MAPSDISIITIEKLNYLVNQLISYGNSNWGAIVSAVDDIPDSSSDNKTPEPLAIEEKLAAPENIEEPAQETEETDGDNEINSEKGSQEKSQDSSQADQTLSNQDIELLQETARSIATTFPAEKTGHNDNSSPNAPGISSRSFPAARHQLNNRASHPSSRSRKQTLTLADLTHSFMNHVRDDRQTKYNYDPQRKSGGMGMPGFHSPANRACDGKELAIQMYATKVFMLLQQSANAYSSLVYAHADIDEQFFLEITIDHEGKLIRTAINPPLKEKDIESAIQKIAERVGLFPPIPKHFNTDVITLTTPFDIQFRKGFDRLMIIGHRRAII